MNLENALQGFLNNDLDKLCIDAAGQPCPNAASPAAVLPGSFAPAHAGHWGLATAAARRLGVQVVFELSIENVDKPTLSLAEVRRRLEQFAGQAPLWLTHAPRFVDKARLFPGAVFVIGVDTAARIIAPRYYDSGPAEVVEVVRTIRSKGCRFLVAGRIDTQGRLLALSDLPLPEEVADLFEPIPPGEFRVDVSSSELRRRSEMPPSAR